MTHYLVSIACVETNYVQRDVVVEAPNPTEARYLTIFWDIPEGHPNIISVSDEIVHVPQSRSHMEILNIIEQEPS